MNLHLSLLNFLLIMFGVKCWFTKFCPRCIIVDSSTLPYYCLRGNLSPFRLSFPFFVLFTFLCSVDCSTINNESKVVIRKIYTHQFRWSIVRLLRSDLSLSVRSLCPTNILWVKFVLLHVDSPHFVPLPYDTIVMDFLSTSRCN